MRLYEFHYSKEELNQLREELRRQHPNLTEEQLDEILPAIAMGAARAGAMLGRGAMAAGRAVGNVASKVGQAVGTAAKTIGGATKQVGQQASSKLGQMAKQAVKKRVSGKLNLGGRTEPSTADVAQQALAQQDAENQVKDATYAQMVKDLESQVQNMKKQLGVK